MNTLGNLNNTRQDFQPSSLEQKRRPVVAFLVIAVLLIGVILAASYFLFFRQTAPNLAGQESPRQDVPAATSTEVQIFEDEPIVKDSQAVISGTVRNISRAPLTDLSLEFELKRRNGGNTEVRNVSVEPSNLAPGEDGKYSFSLARQEFSETQIKHLKSATRSAFIAFKTAPGARRPKELPPQQQTRTIIIQRPSPRSKGEEFINTPDTPIKVH